MRKKRYTGRRHRLQSVATSARRFSSGKADLGGNTAPGMGLRLVFLKIQHSAAEHVKTARSNSPPTANRTGNLPATADCALTKPECNLRADHLQIVNDSI